jgi:hypothetical protein
MDGPFTSRPFLRFQVAGIPVAVQPLFVVVPLVMAAGSGSGARAAIWAAVAMLSVLWHELGHAFVQRWFGYSPRIELHAMGGLAYWPPGADPTALQALLVTLAGPGAGLLLGAGVWLATRRAEALPYLAQVAVQDVLWVNVGWSLFNLLPVLPLDGGHLLDHGARLFTGVRQPRWVGYVTVAVAGGLGVLALAHGEPFGAMLAAMAVVAGVGRIRGEGRARLPSRSRPAGKAAPESLGQLEASAARAEARLAARCGDGRRAFAALLRPARRGLLDWGDLSVLVEAAIEAGRGDDLVALCRARLGASPRAHDADPLARLAAHDLADAGHVAEALAVSQLAFERVGGAQHAFVAACQLARLGREDDALAWLERALGAGLHAGGEVLTEAALAPLRRRDEFWALVGRPADAPRRR